MRLFTKNGHDFYVVASLLQKSLRRGDVVLASRAVNEMLPRYANYCWNRLLTVSAEDCAEMVTGEVLALYLAWSKVNDSTADRSKGRIFFAKAIVLLAKAHHSRDADELNILVSDRLPDEAFANALVEIVEDAATNGSEPLDIPEWVYDVHTREGKRRGMTKEDFLRDEHRAITDPLSIFGNFDAMLERWGYEEPVLDFG
jgi:replication-associated recombination protein RarA